MLANFQGHRIRGQGYIRPQPIDLILAERNTAVDTALAASLPNLITFSYLPQLKLANCEKKIEIQP